MKITRTHLCQSIDQQKLLQILYKLLITDPSKETKIKSPKAPGNTNNT